MSGKSNRNLINSDEWEALENNVPVLEMTPDGDIIRANRLFLELIGHGKDEICKLHHKDLCTVETVVSREYAEFWRALRHGETVNGIFQRKRGDAALLWLDAVYIPMRNDEGKLVKIISFCTDATLRAQQAHNDSRKLSTIDNTILCADFSLQGVILRANANFASSVGYSPEELIGMDCSMLLDDSEGERRLSAELWAKLRAGHSYSGRIRRRASNGEPVWMQAAYIPLAGQSGSIERVTFFANDISDLMRREIRLLEEMQGIAMIAESMDNAAVVTDRFNKISYVNPGFTRLFGYARKDVLGRPLSALLLLPSPAAAGAGKKQQGEKSAYREVQVICKSGRSVWCAMHVSAIKRGGRGGLSLTVLTDINSAKLQSNLQLKALEAISRGVSSSDVLRMIREEAESAMPGSMLLISKTGEDGEFASVIMPQRLARPGAWPAADTGAPEGADAAGRVETPEEIAAASGKPHCNSVQVISSQDRLLGRLTLCTADRRALIEGEKQLMQAMANLCALTMERDQTKQTMRSLAFYDQATGLPNRELFLAEAARLLQDNPGQQHAVLAVSLNRYKRMIDSLGHESMDSVLRKISRRLMAGRNSGNIGGRISDDVFAVLVPFCDAAQAGEKAEKIQAQLAVPVREAGLKLVPSASIGISVYPESGDDIDSLLSNATLAIARNGERGQGKFNFYDPEQDCALREAVEMESELRSAIESGALKLVYQPQVLMQKQGLHGVEALCRWDHPVFGPISPSRFIPLAEESGLMENLWRWSLDEACRQLSAWRGSGVRVPAISVNLSASSFHNPAMPDEALETVRRHSLRPEDIIIELTEVVLLDDNPNTRKCISTATRHGFRFSMDDFGTGYSSLDYLRQLPFVELKLDQSFVRDLAEDVTSQRLSQAVSYIAKSLNLTTIAEGIETERQYELLAGQGYDVAQGYLKARPMPAPAFEDWYAGFASGQPGGLLPNISNLRN